jgi:hypothetical protein
MGRFVSATGQFLLATYEQFSRPPTGSSICPLTSAIISTRRECLVRWVAYDGPCRTRVQEAVTTNSAPSSLAHPGGGCTERRLKMNLARVDA